jgi:hypothetical protein
LDGARNRIGVMGSRACREIWLEVAASRVEHWQTTRQRAMRTLVARGRTRTLATGEPRGWPGRLGEVARDGVVRMRGGLLPITGQLWAVDSGRGV